jgi:putative sigma-54 modulation protein
VPARVTAKPLTVEEAADQLLADGSEFVAFVNAQTEQLNVLFRRPDGDLGLIAPRRAGGRR